MSKTSVIYPSKVNIHQPHRRDVKVCTFCICMLLSSCFFSGVNVLGTTPFPLFFTFVIFLLILRYLDRSAIFRIKTSAKSIDIVCCSLFLWSLVTIFWSNGMNLYLSELLKFMISIMTFFIVQHLSMFVVLDGKGNLLIRSVLWLLFAVSTISSILVILEHAGIINFVNLTFTSRRSYWRPQGLLGEPNFGAIMLTIGMTASIVLFAMEKHFILAVGLLVQLSGIILTGSRNGLINALFIIFAFLLISLRVKNSSLKLDKDILVAVFLIGLFCALIFFILVTSERDVWIIKSTGRLINTIEGVGDIDQSILLRIYAREVARQFISTGGIFLLIGKGLGSSISIIEQYLGKSMATHDTFLAILMETGLIGLILWIGLCVLGILQSIQIKKWGKKLSERPSELFGDLFLISMFIFIISSFSFHILTVLKIFWIILGLISGVYKAHLLTMRMI